MLTVKAAAERAGVSVSLIYLWCKEQRLVHFRVGAEGRRGRIRIAPADLDAVLASLKVGGRKDPPPPPVVPRRPRYIRMKP